MGSIIQIYNSISIYIVAALVIIVLILFIISMVSISAIGKLEKKFRKMTRGTENSNLEEIIEKYMEKIDGTSNEIAMIKEKTEQINNKITKCIQKVEIIRYKAFDDVGSDLSFSIVLLDENDDGILITSIYGRNESTIYSKPIDKGISRYELSEEEKQVLGIAVNK